MFNDFQFFVQQFYELLEKNLLDPQEYHHNFYDDFLVCIARTYKEHFKKQLKKAKKQKNGECLGEFPCVFGEGSNTCLKILFQGVMSYLNFQFCADFKKNQLEASRTNVKNDTVRNSELVIVALSENLKDLKNKGVDMSLEDAMEISELNVLRDQIMHKYIMNEKGDLILDEMKALKEKLKGLIERVTHTTCEDATGISHLEPKQKHKELHYFYDDQNFYIAITKIKGWQPIKSVHTFPCAYLPWDDTYDLFKRVEYINQVADLLKKHPSDKRDRCTILVDNGLVYQEEKII